MKKKILFLFCIVVLTGCQEVDSNLLSEGNKSLRENRLLGSWDVKEVHWISNDTTVTIEHAQPGILMLTPERYSIIWTPTRHARAPFKILSKPTDDEIKSGFRSIVFNSGTYLMTDSTITTKALLAKVPGFEGGMQFYDYQLKNKILTLTMYDETYPDGTKPDWAGIWKTQFVLGKIDSQNQNDITGKAINEPL